MTDLVLTHLHMDHVGGLLTEGLQARLRSDLRMHLGAHEAEFWTAPGLSRTCTPQPVPDVLRTVASRCLDEYHVRLRTFETEYEVAPGVLHDRAGEFTSVLFAAFKNDFSSEFLQGGSIYPAMQNFYLAASAQGLEACITGWASYGGERALRDAVGIADEWFLVGAKIGRI